MASCLISNPLLIFDLFPHITRQMLTWFSDNIDNMSPIWMNINCFTLCVGQYFVPRGEGANIINVTLNTSQYLYNILSSLLIFLKSKIRCLALAKQVSLVVRDERGWYYMYLVHLSRVVSKN